MSPPGPSAASAARAAMAAVSAGGPGGPGPDPVRGRVHLAQGEYAVGRDPDAEICTLLGSCVATCLYDPAAGIGGMNHFLLPEGRAGAVSAASYGAHAIELLVNALIRIGASRLRLRAKVFGGAQVVEGLSDIGLRNAEFVRLYLGREGLPIENESLGGAQARRVEFWPASGRARLKLLVAPPPRPVPARLPPASEVELF